MWEFTRAFPESDNGLLLADVRGVGLDALDERSPQFRLPVQINVEAVRVAVKPVDEQLRTLPSVGGEQPGQPSRHRITPASSQLGFVAGVKVAQMPGQDAAPRLIQRGVDDFQQRPRHGVGGPRIVVDRAGDLGDQRAWAAERHSRAHTITGTTTPDDMREPLAEPPLDAARRHQHQLLGERVGQRVGQQGAEPVG